MDLLNSIAETGNITKYFCLRGLAEGFVIINGEFTQLRFVHETSLVAQLYVVVLSFHQYNYVVETLALSEQHSETER